MKNNDTRSYYLKIKFNDGSEIGSKFRKINPLQSLISKSVNLGVSQYFIRVNYGGVLDGSKNKIRLVNEGSYGTVEELKFALKCFNER